MTPLTGEHKNIVRHVAIFPASHYIVGPEKMAEGLKKIQAEMEEQVKKFTEEGKLLEAQRIQQRTNYDMEMLQEVGMCKGIENYSAVLSGRAPGSTPQRCWTTSRTISLLMVDESHVMLPQVRGMFGGDYSRKKTLVEYGFRLPSAFDNRPLKFEEFESKIHQKIFCLQPPPASMSASIPAVWQSKSSAPPACWIRLSWCAQSKGRLKTCWARYAPALTAVSVPLSQRLPSRWPRI